MADIVLGIGVSHSPLLNSPAEDYTKHAQVDAGGRTLIDINGRTRTYAEMVAAAPPSMGEQLRPEVIAERATRCARNVEVVAQRLSDARLDALIVIGDDQKEQYEDDNMPAVLIYWGDTIDNCELDLPESAPAFWRTARSRYHEPEGSRSYPVAAELAHHLIERLMDDGFDISQSRRLGKPRGEGHAFGFVHRRLMGHDVTPIVPVALNTYFPPNQLRPKRCLELGRAIASAVRDYGDRRVGILASGGLSHFAVDEALDGLVLQAIENHDEEALAAIPERKLNSGSSEIRNWIVLAGATGHLKTEWRDYAPCYRSPAGTGCGMGFMILS